VGAGALFEAHEEDFETGADVDTQRCCDGYPDRAIHSGDAEIVPVYRDPAPELELRTKG
jgi:hypothetical protein